MVSYGPLSYEVQLEDGDKICYHVDHLWKHTTSQLQGRTKETKLDILPNPTLEQFPPEKYIGLTCQKRTETRLNPIYTTTIR